LRSETIRSRGRRALHDAAERAVLGEDEVHRDGLLRLRRGVAVARRDGADDARQAGEDGRPAVEPVELEAEDRLALDPPLQLVRRPDGEDPAVVDDGEALAQLLGLGHVVGGQEDRPTGHGRLPVHDELADDARRGDVEAERRPSRKKITGR
jgi:hypothetical protein